MSNTYERIDTIYKPSSVAIIGANDKKGSVGNTLLINFKKWPIDGPVYVVNPELAGQEVEGFPCFANINDIEGAVDLAVVAVPGFLVSSTVQDAAEKKVKTMIIVSSGFAEKGEEGRIEQENIRKICEEAGIRVMGPNCQGVFNYVDGMMVSFVLPPNDTPGKVAVVSQSGATANLVDNYLRAVGVYTSYVAATGNQMDLKLIDFIEYMAENEENETIITYLEGVPDPTRFRKAGIRALENHRPIIALKGGRSEAGQRAAMSHTASLSGSYATFCLAAEKSGIIVVDEIVDLVNYAKAFSCKKRPKGPRVASIVQSGASGIMMSDKYEQYGLEGPVLSEETQNKLFEIIPDYCSATNPVDVGHTVLSNPGEIIGLTKVLAESGEVDMLIISAISPAYPGADRYTEDIIKVCREVDIPVFLYLTSYDEEGKRTERLFAEENLPCYTSIDETVRSMSILWKYEEMYNDRLSLLPVVEDVPEYNGVLPATEPEVKALLTENGIRVPAGAFGATEEDLITSAKDLNYPLVAKVVSKDITHKSDVGGVILKIQNEEELRAAYQSIMSSVGELAPGKTVDGIMAEEMAGGDFLEAIVGVTRDETFGPIIMCGLGGIYVEVMKDVAQNLVPVTHSEAVKMIDSLKSAKVFHGFRKTYSYDIDALADALVKISELALSLGDSFTDLEINPLIVMPEGQGVMALDGVLTAAKA